MMSQQSGFKEIKIVLLGDAAVGKTTLISQYVNQDVENISATVGAQYFTKNATYNNENFFFQVWDTAGAEKYSSLANLYYKDASVAIIVYDITIRKSFDKVQKWVKELQEKGPEQVIYAIVGNKIDLVEREEVPYEMAMNYAKSLGAIYQLTSAKENKGIGELFDKIAQQIYDKQKQLLAIMMNDNARGQQQQQFQQQNQNQRGQFRLNNQQAQPQKTDNKGCC